MTINDLPLCRIGNPIWKINGHLEIKTTWEEKKIEKYKRIISEKEKQTEEDEKEIT